MSSDLNSQFIKESYKKKRPEEESSGYIVPRQIDKGHVAKKIVKSSLPPRKTSLASKSAPVEQPPRDLPSLGAGRKSRKSSSRKSKKIKKGGDPTKLKVAEALEAMEIMPEVSKLPPPQKSPPPPKKSGPAKKIKKP